MEEEESGKSTLIQTEDVTAIVHTYLIDGQEFSGVGAARKHPSDEFDSALGIALASGRAFKELGAELERHAQHRVNVAASAVRLKQVRDHLRLGILADEVREADVTPREDTEPRKPRKRLWPFG